MTNLSSNADRNFERDNVVKAGIISCPERQLRMPCIVRELKEDGARLQVEAPYDLPKTFELKVEVTGFSAPCAVEWREPKEIGVRFVRSRPGDPSGSGTSDGGEAAALFKVRAVKQDGPEPRQSPPNDPRSRGTATKSSSSMNTVPPILVAEDDPDDRMLLQDAFKQCASPPPLEFVNDGHELIQYLSGEGPYLGKPSPGLILLDLNMPRVDGRKALVRMKNNPAWRSLPVIVFTTSNAELDIERTYGLGVSSYIQKPSTFEELVELSQMLIKFWSTFAKTKDGPVLQSKAG